MPERSPRNIHVLFVHGVGAHSRLSSLLQAYQSLRANTRSPETAIEAEDLNPEWRLQGFDDVVPYLKLHLPGAPSGATDAVYLYEVNYSALAGVIRANHPLDLTELFVGFDLAVNVARARLDRPRAEPVPAGSKVADARSLALTVQRLAGVFVAATVPILGVPSLVFRSYTKGLVATFSRFFEDVATFALDLNGEQLISAHVDRTVEAILDPKRFREADDASTPGYGRDLLVFAAHSLGTIVIHNFIMRHGLGSGRALPSRVLTFGSPIGLVCWLRLFLDCVDLDFGRRNEEDLHYFSWAPAKRAADAPPLPPIKWINVVNHVDPIATAFPLQHVNLSQSDAANARELEGGQVHQRFLRTGESVGAAHTAYFEDRDGFLEILSRMVGLRAGVPEDVTEGLAGRDAKAHWRAGIGALLLQGSLWWLVGVLAIAAYLGILGWGFGNWGLLAFMALFAWPSLTIGYLAFWQRLFCGKPTKRNAGSAIRKLPWDDLHAFPYWARHLLRRRQTEAQERAKVLGATSSLGRKAWMWILSFLPSLFAMLLPLLAFWAMDALQAPRAAFREYGFTFAAVLLGLFLLYSIAFAISEFIAYWREAMIKASGA